MLAEESRCFPGSLPPAAMCTERSSWHNIVFADLVKLRARFSDRKSWRMRPCMRSVQSMATKVLFDHASIKWRPSPNNECTSGHRSRRRLQNKLKQCRGTLKKAMAISLRRSAATWGSAMGMSEYGGLLMRSSKWSRQAAASCSKLAFA